MANPARLRPPFPLLQMLELLMLWLIHFVASELLDFLPLRLQLQFCVYS